MESGVATLGAGFYLFVSLFFIILAILWILVPFAIFGIKPRLERLEDELKNSNRLNKEILEELRSSKSKD